jgi:CheY-like chemotaxis protein
MNLVVNARDAMPNGGRIEIATGNITVDRANPRDMVPPGSYVLLSVSDTGEGMTPDVRRHLFEPFFTTKEQGKGTGLGLATIYGVVKQSGGWVLVDSEVGQGTRFSLYFPAAAQPVASWHPPAPLAHRRTAGAGETILVVEDEELVRQFARRVLEQAGYRVIAAINGEEALVRLHKEPQGVDLVLTDVVMPRMSGRALVEKIAAIQPAIRVIYMSGYTGHTIEEQWFDRTRPLLAKPFTSTGLTAAVRAAFDNGKTPGESLPT